MSVNPIAPESLVSTLDMHFRGVSGSIAVYLIPHSHGAVLVECGPGSTVPALIAGLKDHGLKVSDITDVLVTHIHLDHAGAAGWLAQQGARVHVHPVGAPHLLDPERLLTSAKRIYGDTMDTLWGQFLAVPEQRLSILEDDREIDIHGLRFRPLDTPGHAYHHFAYIYEDICFTGDIGGVRMNETRHLRLPMPPPEFHLELWRESARRLQNEHEQGAFKRIAPTHFGIFDDAGWHLKALLQALDEVEEWILRVMPAGPTLEQLTDQFLAWTRERSLWMGIDPIVLDNYEIANPSGMSAAGIYRYWHKVRNAEKA